MTVGRVAVEKNLEAFLALNLPGSKVVIGEGPQKAELERRYPKARFLGEKTGSDLTSHLAAADVFVFPSLTDTFGVVQLEALACGTPVAAFPVTGPLDVIADHPIGVLDTDLRRACIGALACPVKPAAILRSSVPGRTARGSSSAISVRCSRAVRCDRPAAWRVAARSRAKRSKLVDRSSQPSWNPMAEIIKLGRHQATGLRPRDGRAGL